MAPNEIVEQMTRSEELSRDIRQRDEQIKRLQEELREYIYAEKALIAAGIVPEGKVNEAHELVRRI